jgi:hypothetical protein
MLMTSLVKISDLFHVSYGVNLELINIEEVKAGSEDSIFFVSRTENNNGISAIVKKMDDITPNPGHSLSVAGGGSVLSTFYHPYEYYSGRDIYILVPKETRTVAEMLFFAYCIQLNKYKYNYGRQANKTLRDIHIPKVVPEDYLQTIAPIFSGINTDLLTIKSVV